MRQSNEHSEELSLEEAVLEQAVGHSGRQEILDFLAGKETGIDEAELAGTLGLNPSLVRYHLRVLQSANLVAPVEGSEPGAIGRYAAVPAGL